MAKGRSIAAAQTIPIRGDVAANVEAHARLIRVAADERISVVIFPELSLTGYELDLADALAFSEHDDRLAPLAELASVHALTLVVGAPVRIGPLLHIGSFAIFPDGRLEIYTKQHLGAFPSDVSPDGVVPPPERTVFHPGDRDPLIPFGDGNAALAVCADVGRPAHAKAAADRGANGYLASMFVIPADMEQDAARLKTYAMQHSMAVALANYGGPTGGLPSAGGSAVWSPRGELLAQLPQFGSGIAVAIEAAHGWQARAITVADP